MDGVTDASPLSGLPKLRQLTITNAALDLTTLSELVQLTDLKLDYATPGTLAKPGSLDALDALVHLRRLDVSDGCIKDISALAGMTELVELDLYSNCVSDIAALTGLKRLEHVDLTDNFLDCVSPDTQTILDGLTSQGTDVANDCE